MSSGAERPSACPVCRGAGPLSRVEGYHDPVGDRDYGLWRCGACGVVFAHPFEEPGAAWYAKYSPAEDYEGCGGWRFGWFLSLGFRPGGRLLDVGCGTGQFLLQARAAGYQVLGLDANPEAIRGAKERGIEARLGHLADLPARDAEGGFDVITIFEVLEHVDDPAGTLALARRLLKPGGGLAVTVPNELRPLPFGRDAFDYPPHHLTRWTPAALEGFLVRNGFRIVKSQHTHVTPWDYSRFSVGWATAKALSLTKRLLYGRRAEGATLTQLIGAGGKEESGGVRGGLVGLIRDKGFRVRLVRRFQDALGFVLAPFFLPMLLYYRVTRPAGGTGCSVLCVPESEGR